MPSSPYGHRLPSGGLIDRTRAIPFSFNARKLLGHPGDSLASALIANGVNLVGRGFKYHRPRGFYGVDVEDPNSMLSVRDAYAYEPALRAGQVRLCEGLEAHSVTGWPSPGVDLAGGVQLLGGLLGAGFYYKTFMWPNWGWFEPLIRRSTGFGRPTHLRQARNTQRRHASCDVLIIGAGPAGLSAARSLLGTGLAVILADDRPRCGGSLNWEASTVDGQPGAAWAHAVCAQLSDDPGVTVLTSTTVTAAYEDNHFTLIQQLSDERGVHTERHWSLRATQVILATGMIDRPLLFAGNDRPGIMLSSAVRRLMGEFGVSPAGRLAVYTNNDSGYLTAIDAMRAGIDVAAIVDVRSESKAIHSSAVRDAGIPCLFEGQIESTSGYRRLRSITVRGKDRRRRTIACTGLAVSGGFTPLIQLASHRGSKPVYDSRLGSFLIRELPGHWYAAGGVAGALDLEVAIEQGRSAAAAVGLSQGKSLAPMPAESVASRSYGAVEPCWRPEYGSPSKVWVDLQNDVKMSDVDLAVRENYVSVEHLKRYTTLGMGTDQGRTSNVNGLALLAGLTEQRIEAVGTTTFRPPYTAVRMDTIANDRRGDLYRPRRHLPAGAVHQSLDAVMADFGWERPDWYRSNGADREAAVAAEMSAVRSQVGVFDGSPLGKIEVTGPDAAAFLAKFYVSNMATLKPGGIRYSVMLREDGVIFDDGVVARLSHNHFLASPSSGQAEAVAAWFERWRQTEWPAMRVAIAPVTSNWASMAIAGPRSRELLARLEPTFDISHAAFAHMQVREGHVGGVIARIARVSFTGELQYEISVQSRYGASLLKELLTPADDLVPRAVGLEAWLRLRLEKGYLHLGSETNGRTTPIDIGMGDLVARRLDDFIGRRSLRLSFATSPEREQLVGIVAQDGTLQVGGRVMSPGHSQVPCPTEGYVTSACWSPSMAKSIGLALIERGRARMGEIVAVYCAGRIVRCRIAAPTFYDPTHERLQL
jgi:sarcosine oxidase subunit alpha